MDATEKGGWTRDEQMDEGGRRYGLGGENGDR